MFNKNSSILLGIFLALTLTSASNASQNVQTSGLNVPAQLANLKINDMHAGKKYNYFQTDQRIFMANQNNTLVNFYEISIPDIIFAHQACSKIVFSSNELYSISACRDLSENVTYLVMVSYLSSRPFYFYSLKTDLKANVSMQLVDSNLAVREVNETTGFTRRIHNFKVNLGSFGNSVQPLQLLSSSDVYTLTRTNSVSRAVAVENTTIREWFFLFLAILGSLALIARCTSKKDDESQIEERRANQQSGLERSEGASSTNNYRLLDEAHKTSLSPLASESRV